MTADGWLRQRVRAWLGPDEARERQHRQELEAADERRRRDLNDVRVKSMGQVAVAQRERQRVAAAFDRAAVEYTAQVEEVAAAHAVQLEQLRRQHEAELGAAHAMVDDALARHERAATELQRFLDVEPPPVDGCVKVRLRDDTEAREWIRRLARDTGRSEVEFSTYRCPTCPRQPVSTDRFLHVANAVASERTGRGGASRRVGHQETSGRARMQGRLLEQRIDPEVRQRLRGIAGGEAS